MPLPRTRSTAARLLTLAAALAASAALAACTGGSGSGSVPGPATGAASAVPGTSCAAAPTASTALPAQLSPYSKVLLIAMENKTEEQVFGSPDAPYLTGLADSYGRPTALDAGYPSTCPSLAAYLLMTSGSTHGVCDDKNPKAHKIRGESVFSQLSSTGRQWRNYAESMPENCSDTNGSHELYAVRHAPAVYYVDERARCLQWQVPLGDLTRGALVEDLAAWRLPEFSFVTPNQCHNMHGAVRCPTGTVRAGDAWVKSWMAKILASPDYTSGRLVVVITWDEGTKTDNHIPGVIVSPTTRGIRSATRYTQCSVLRTVQEIVRVPPLGCAVQAPSMLAEFKLAS